jgi:hypothetical protein
MVRIIGVVATAKGRSIGEDPRASFYLPILSSQKETLFGVTLLLKTQGDPAGYANAVRHVVRSLDSALAVFDARTMETHLKNALILPRMGAVMVGLCGAMARHSEDRESPRRQIRAPRKAHPPADPTRPEADCSGARLRNLSPVFSASAGGPSTGTWYLPVEACLAPEWR